MGNKQKKLEMVRGKVVLGIDIAKDKHWAVVQFPDGSLGKPFPIYADGIGLNHFWQQLPSHLAEYSMSELVVGLEPTGHYWKGIAHFLYEKGLHVVLVNPLHTKKYQEIDDNSPLKSDKKDARMIAQIVASGKFLRANLEDGPFAELRQLSSERAHLIKELRRANNYGRALLHQLFPEWTKVFKGPWGKASLLLLEVAATPKEIIALGQKKIVEILRGTLKKGDACRRADLLLTFAKTSASVGAAQQSQVMALRRTLERMAFYNRQKEDIEKQMKVQLKEIPYSKQLLTLPNFGEISLACLLGEIGDIRNFEHANELIKITGLNLYQTTSGNQEKDESKILRHISKRGRPRARTSLYFASLRNTQKHSPLRAYYDGFRERGKCAKVALIAMSRKFLRIIFAMVRDGVEFSEELVTG